jgi:hypothetical protein
LWSLISRFRTAGIQRSDALMAIFGNHSQIWVFFKNQDRQLPCFVCQSELSICRAVDAKIIGQSGYACYMATDNPTGWGEGKQRERNCLLD